jgi:aldose sugar dehydrogenase
LGREQEETTMRHAFAMMLGGLLLAACGGDAGSATPEAVMASPRARAAPAAAPFAITELASFDEPWALARLPDGAWLVTEKRGRLKLLAPGGAVGEVSGGPAVAYGGQGGLGDVVLHPRFEQTGWVYLSYAEPGDGGAGAAVARARLVREGDGGRLEGLQVVWRQQPKVSGGGHYGHRIAFDRDGLLFISSGDRQKFDPAQDMGQNLGKILRLRDDGSVPADNPFAARGGMAAQVWTLGHRNPLGIAFDAQGRLWEIEMGPAGGDELNLIARGRNYGWPLVSDGDHYDGRDIPDHATAPRYEAPKLAWSPVIAPAGLLLYSGDEFPDWKGNALVPALKSQALVRIGLDGERARELARYPMERRMRAIAQGPRGEIYLLEDGEDARLLRLDDPSSRPDA